MYYDLSKILSYNAFLNFIIGSRGCGKTYGTSKYVVKQFLKKGEQFAYIRRHKSDLKTSVPDFFTAMLREGEFPNHKFRTSGNKFYCDDNICGYAMSLSTAQNLKSSNFSNVKYIIFDEFINEGNVTYIKNEVETFLGLIETIARTRDVKVICLANAITMINDYFIYFNITSLPYMNTIKTYKDGLIAVEYVVSEEYMNFKKQTTFGKLIQDTPFGDYAINNNFRMDDKSFIQKKKGTAKYVFGFIYKNETFGVWFDYKVGKVFISNDYYKDSIIFSCTLEDGKDNTMFMSVAKKYNAWKVFIENYKLGNVYYESQKIKNRCYSLFASLVRF